MEVELKNSHASTCDLVNLIYQAPLKPHLWPSILNTIRLLCGADQCTLFFYDNIKPVKSFASAARVNENAIRHYLKDSIEQQAAQINNQLKSLPEGLVVTDTDINHYVGDDYSDIVGQNYMDVFWPNLHFEAGIVLSRGKNGCSGLGLQNFKSSHPLLKENLKLLQELSPHLCQAMRLHQQIAHIGYAKQALTEVLEQASYGLVLLDKSYSVKFANSVAKNYLNKINLYHATLVQDLSEVKKSWGEDH